jgi:hypothetical protein
MAPEKRRGHNKENHFSCVYIYGGKSLRTNESEKLRFTWKLLAEVFVALGVW